MEEFSRIDNTRDKDLRNLQAKEFPMQHLPEESGSVRRAERRDIEEEELVQSRRGQRLAEEDERTKDWTRNSKAFERSVIRQATLDLEDDQRRRILTQAAGEY